MRKAHIHIVSKIFSYPYGILRSPLKQNVLVIGISCNIIFVTTHPTMYSHVDIVHLITSIWLRGSHIYTMLITFSPIQCGISRYVYSVEQELTRPQPGIKVLPLGRAPAWWRCSIIGVAFPKSHGVNPCCHFSSQLPDYSHKNHQTHKLNTQKNSHLTHQTPTLSHTTK